MRNHKRIYEKDTPIVVHKSASYNQTWAIEWARGARNQCAAQAGLRAPGEIFCAVCLAFNAKYIEIFFIYAWELIFLILVPNASRSGAVVQPTSSGVSLDFPGPDRGHAQPVNSDGAVGVPSAISLMNLRASPSRGFTTVAKGSAYDRPPNDVVEMTDNGRIVAAIETSPFVVLEGGTAVENQYRDAVRPTHTNPPPHISLIFSFNSL